MTVDRGKSQRPVHEFIDGMTVSFERKDEKQAELLDRVHRCAGRSRSRGTCLHASGITYGFYGEGLVKSAYDGIYLGDFDNAASPSGFRKCRWPGSRAHCRIRPFNRAGRVIEVASGQSLYQFEKQIFLDPHDHDKILPDRYRRAATLQPPKGPRCQRNSLDLTRWESGGGGMVSTITDFAPLWSDAAQWRDTRRRTYLSPATFKAMTTITCAPGAGVARDLFAIAMASASLRLACASIRALPSPQPPARSANSSGMAPTCCRRRWPRRLRGDAGFAVRAAACQPDDRDHLRCSREKSIGT